MYVHRLLWHAFFLVTLAFIIAIFFSLLLSHQTSKLDVSLLNITVKSAGQVNRNTINYCNHNVMQNSQKVISFSVYGDYAKKMPNLVRHVVLSIALIPFYEEWRVRVYHDQHLPMETIKRLQKDFDFVDLCDARQVLPVIGNLSSMQKMMWRFLPIGDPSVDVFVSRDIDGPITTRESTAVAEWMESDKLLHVMRDHPQHNIPILGGLWGYRNHLNRKMGEEIMKLVLEIGKKDPDAGKNSDQMFLSKFVWPRLRLSVMAHDSYNCNRFERCSRPFLTRRREGESFVGCPSFFNGKCWTRKECPVLCRPLYHENWKYC